MREARSAKVIGDVGRLSSRVAEHEAKKERAFALRQSYRAPLEHGTKAVGGASQGSASGAGADRLDREDADDVTIGEPRRAGRRSFEPARHEQTLTAACRANIGFGR